MKTVARLSAEDRSDLFRNTANRMQMSDAIVEKDFWVCFTLDYLFHRSPWKDSITFKGGTSLSKAYHLINRFSEDIDLILDWRILGYSLNEPWEERSNTKQDTFNKEATVTFATDVNSVFDIAWYAFARLLITDVSEKDNYRIFKPKVCKYCGEIFSPNGPRQEYCDEEDNPECRLARKRKNRQDCDARKRQAKQNG